jgi:cytochrome c oxidase subunit 2
VAWGSDIATSAGCRNCHSTDGSPGLGPSWSGLYGSTVTLEGGATVTATAAYIEESIRNPDAGIVAGYPPGLMQSDYATTLTADEIAALVAYISSR